MPQELISPLQIRSAAGAHTRFDLPISHPVLSAGSGILGMVPVPLKEIQARSTPRLAVLMCHSPSPAATAALEAQLEGLREILRRADAVADELRQERDRWRSMAEHQQRLIEDQRPRSWWKRLTG